MAALAQDAEASLRDGVSSLDVVEVAVRQMEASGLYVAGKGSAPNVAGHVELDASIMFGANRQAGAVSAIRDVISPISVARGVMDMSPSVMLTGSGANAFADQNGYPGVDNPDEYYVTAAGRQ